MRPDIRRRSLSILEKGGGWDRRLVRRGLAALERAESFGVVGGKGLAEELAERDGGSGRGDTTG